MRRRHPNQSHDALELEMAAAAVPSLSCPITLKLMRDPVFAADGHTYERAAIEEWFHKGSNTSPKTGAHLEHNTLTPNHALRATIEELEEACAKRLVPKEKKKRAKTGIKARNGGIKAVVKQHLWSFVVAGVLACVLACVSISMAFDTPSTQLLDGSRQEQALCHLTGDVDYDGTQRLLFDRAFGGAYSLIERARFNEVGDGILVADLSHPVAEFCGANRASNDARGCRSVKLSWVPKRAVGGLAHTSLAPTQPDTLLDVAMGMVKAIRAEFKKSTPGGITPEMFFVLAIREPRKRGLSVHLMMNWLNPNHTSIPMYQRARGMLPAQERNELTLDWEHRQDYKTLGLMPPVAPKFHAECLELYADWRLETPKPDRPGSFDPEDPFADMWPRGESIPPLAKMIDMRSRPGLPAHMIGSHAAEAPPLLHKKVTVIGLKSRAKLELNGLSGTAQAFDASTGRYTVQFKGREGVVEIKGRNLELLEESEGGSEFPSE